MNTPARLPALLAYLIPVIGWLYRRPIVPLGSVGGERVIVGHTGGAGAHVALIAFVSNVTAPFSANVLILEIAKRTQSGAQPFVSR